MFAPGDLCLFEEEQIVTSPLWSRGPGGVIGDWWYARKGAVVVLIHCHSQTIVSFLDHPGRIGKVRSEFLRKL